MSGSLNSRNKRKTNKFTARFFVKYRVTDMSLGTPLMIEKKAELVEVAEDSFGILTDYPLQKGHVITLVDKNGISELPDYGIVKWIEQTEQYFKVSLVFNKFKIHNHGR